MLESAFMAFQAITCPSRLSLQNWSGIPCARAVRHPPALVLAGAGSFSFCPNFGGRDRHRTCDLPGADRLLSRTELHAHIGVTGGFDSATSGATTRRSTFELRPHLELAKGLEPP